ncbi:MAG TPA: transcription elongation factor [Polyangia bacterium]|nr:transcription elongation factor [Polyangia bacterium]
MPSKQTIAKAKQDLAEGKRPSTAAGEFVREEMEHIREGRHGAANTKQAIAIGLSKARRSGVPLPPPGEGQASPETRRSARRDAAAGRRPRKNPSARRSRASTKALRRRGGQAASHQALSAQAKGAARKRGPRARAQAARKAAATRRARAR